MLPEVTLKNVTRDDVDRIAWWLEDVELTNRWFGRYGVDDPVHPGYEPRHMLEANDRDWCATFSDPYRAILSIYNAADAHIGECQVHLDGDEGAELSLIIGRKDLWHHGYGTSTMLALLDKVFTQMHVGRAWVAVPADNRPAIGLFEKLGFTIDGERTVKHDSINVAYMTISAGRYSSRDSKAQQELTRTPVVAIAGLSGSESEVLGREVARLLESSFLDEEIRDDLAERVGCSPAELESFENSYKSFWSRLLSPIVVPTELATAYESGYHGYVPQQSSQFDVLLGEPITKELYVKKLRRIVRRYAALGDSVIHSRGCHLFLPADVEGLTVFVSASEESRARKFAKEDDTLEDSRERLEQIDRAEQEISARLFGCHVDDPSKYDITVNLDRMTVGDAAELIVDVLGRRVVDKPLTPARQGIGIGG